MENSDSAENHPQTTAYPIAANGQRYELRQIRAVIADTTLDSLTSQLSAGQMYFSGRSISSSQVVQRLPVIFAPHHSFDPDRAPSLHPDERHTYELSEWWDAEEVLLRRLADELDCFQQICESIQPASGLDLTAATDRVGNFLAFRFLSRWSVQMHRSAIRRSIWIRAFHPKPRPSAELSIHVRLLSGNESVEERIQKLPDSGIELPVTMTPDSYSLALFDQAGSLLARDSGTLLLGRVHSRISHPFPLTVTDSSGTNHQISWHRWNRPPASRIDSSRPWASRPSTRRMFNERARERARLALFRSDERAETVAHLRRLLSSLETTELLVWDPYLDAKAIKDFLNWVDPNTRIRILCGAPPRTLCGNPVKDMADLALKYNAVGSALDSLRNGAPPRHIECKYRVKRTAKMEAIYHDRCLISDDSAWVLGSSLNTIGDKWALIVQLLDPAQLRRLFNEEWAKRQGTASGFHEFSV